MLILSRELGISIAEIRTWASADIGLYKALYWIEAKEETEREKRRELKGHVEQGITNVRGQMRGHSR